ncbi:hypothetical protein ACOMHN_035247 [Nucella lapillus]
MVSHGDDVMVSRGDDVMVSRGDDVMVSRGDDVMVSRGADVMMSRDVCSARPPARGHPGGGRSGRLPDEQSLHIASSKTPMIESSNDQRSLSNESTIRNLVSTTIHLYRLEQSLHIASSKTPMIESSNDQRSLSNESTISGLVGQARQLVQRMRGNGGVDFVRDWKLVTILIGNNDLCRYCSHPKVYTEAQFYQNLVRGLDVLQVELPRTLVSLVEPVNMDTLSRLHGSPLCAGVHHMVCDCCIVLCSMVCGCCMVLCSMVCDCCIVLCSLMFDCCMVLCSMVCGCASFPQSPGAAHRLAQLTAQLQRTVQSLARSGRYDTRRDFTVVHQPCLSHITLPTQEDGSPDLSYFAPDCFHLSAKGQEAAALALWNNMVSPVQGKDTDWTPGQSFNCPSQEQPYLYTVANSRRPSPRTPCPCSCSPPSPSPASSSSSSPTSSSSPPADDCSGAGSTCRFPTDRWPLS